MPASSFSDLVSLTLKETTLSEQGCSSYHLLEEVLHGRILILFHER